MASKEITLAFGSGGRLTNELIRDLFVRHFSNKRLNELEDSAVLRLGRERIAFTTDSYVVTPLKFPGGDIGRIAVCGTVNDLAVKGARPLAVSCGFIIEEGLERGTLEEAVVSMKKAAAEAGVEIVTGDTKVVEKGKADKLFINTSGVGLVIPGTAISQKNIRPGDVIIINGEIAAHGVAVLNARNNLGLSGNIKSDAAPLSRMLNGLAVKFPSIRSMRDVTRGGLATVLNEAAQSSGWSMEIEEELIPVSEPVRNACSVLGLDPLYVANEGKAVIFAPEKYASKILSAMKKDKYGKKAAIIGRVLAEKKASLKVRTPIGSERYAVMLEGEQLPRIC
ncbi:MAG: hydrogenase expression/formation protein HypE [Elusimicrobia bacterium CG08_land_8_20_14_0_20_51_18]|nr:MAG: hydrogenase expression/formation protein HypE [Elusimicrobia bacterium CG08_land_8_20_14_0_20_51_18]